MASVASQAAALPAQAQSRSRIDPQLLLALAITLVITFAAAVADWQQLVLGRLPDNDDVMRLAQVRDWLAGQPFNDLMQYRLGPEGGASMHWSRIGDAGPALILLLLTPLFGASAAELTMAIAYPGILFFFYLLLMGRIAGRLSGEAAAPIGMVIAALAFPTTHLFIPGRIDHHGIQIVLMLLLLERVVAAPSLRAGLIAGVTTALSLAIGLETAPLIVGAMAAMFLLWIFRGGSEDVRAGGFALGLGAVTGALLIFARPQVWPSQWCDGFTPASSSATLVAALCWGVLAVAGRFLPDTRHRIAAAGAVGAAGAAAAFGTSSVCFRGPYGALDPLLMDVWMSTVDEAQPLFHDGHGAGVTLAYGGLCLAGAAVGAWNFITRPEDRRTLLPFTAFLAIGTAGTLLQFRMTYIMAAVASLAFVHLIARLRSAGNIRGGALAALIGAWFLGTGIVYQAAGEALATTELRQSAAGPVPLDGAGCTRGEVLAQLAALPQGTVMAPLDAGAFVIGVTRHRSVAAPYHRNNSGNRAMYDFFRAAPDDARPIAVRLGVDYVVICPNSFADAGRRMTGRETLAGALLAGRVPGWLERVPIRGSMAVYRLR